MRALHDRFAAMDDLARRRVYGMALAAALFLFHAFWMSSWYIEDAAISFSYARYLASGEGWVPFPGAERVEGFSNPTWTLLLAAIDRLGLTPWSAAKLAGAAMGLACLPLAVAWGEAIGGRRRDLLGLLPAFLLAINPQFVLWCMSGLENSVVNLTMAAGAVLTLREVREERVPWSAVFWMLLAVSRPEAPLYAGIGGGIGLLLVMGHRGPKAAAWWLIRFVLLSATPFLAWHAWRYSYFAWELPNTYYAKLHETEKFQPWGWSTKGWRYLRGWGMQSSQGFLGWLYIMGQTGFRGRRGWAGLGILLTLGLFLLPGVGWAYDLPFWFRTEWEGVVTTRVVLLCLTALLLPALGLGRRGFGGRWMAWALSSAVLFFAMYAGGDWMQGFRWVSLAVVPMSVLMADALLQMADALGPFFDRFNPQPSLLAPVTGARRFFARGLDRLAMLLAFVPGVLAANSDAGLPTAIALVVGLPTGLALLQAGLLARTGATLGMNRLAVRAAGPDGRPAPASESLLHLVSFIGNRRGPPLRGLSEGSALGPPWHTALWLGPVALLTITSGIATVRLVALPETSPYDVSRRVAYMLDVQERMDLDHASLLDVDMGAHMWWSGFDITDMAGLIDVPMAHRAYEAPFIKQYVYAQRRPTFAHVHASWARKTRMRSHDEWKSYLSIPDFPTSPWNTHAGNHVRKDLVVQARWPDDGRRVAFQGNAVLEGWQQVGAAVAAGQVFAIDIGWSRSTTGLGFRPVLFLARDGQVVYSRELPPGYDFYPPKKWKRGEVVVGRHALELPADLPLGTYDVGVLLLAPGKLGARLATSVPEGATARDVVFARGEVRWPGALEVVDEVQAIDLAGVRRQMALSRADKGQCAKAETAWRSARRSLRNDHPWRATAEPHVRSALARCWATVAETQPMEQAVLTMELAQAWDHSPSEVRAIGGRLADDYESRAQGADDAEAFALYDAAVRVDPTRSWARRRAEKARARLLYLDAPIPCDELMQLVDRRLQADPPQRIRGKTKHSWSNSEVLNWLTEACENDLIEERARMCLQSREQRTALLNCYRDPAPAPSTE